MTVKLSDAAPCLATIIDTEVTPNSDFLVSMWRMLSMPEALHIRNRWERDHGYVS